MITVLLVVIGVLWLSGTIASMSSFKYYNSTYNNLLNGTLVFDYEYGGLYHFCKPDKRGQYSDGIVVFTNGDGTLRDVKVGPWDYIHGGIMAWMSPYSLYWLFLYKDWFEKNKKSFVK